MKIHGNKIEVYINDSLIAEATDDEFKQGSYGLFTISQPCYFWDVTIDTIREAELEEVIPDLSWEGEMINIFANFSNQEEKSLSSQACIDNFNAYNVHYLGVTSLTYQNDVNKFLSQIGNRGKYIESSSYNEYIQQINDYILTCINNSL